MTMWCIEKLTPNPLNPRSSFDGVEELADSIKVKGLIQPLVITPNGTVVCGHRRLAAAKLAGLGEVPVIVKEYTEQEQFEIMLVENLQRADLTPLQEAKAYQRLKDMGLEQAEITRRLGVNTSRVSCRLAILRLDLKVQEMCDNFEIPLILAPVLAKVGDPDKQRRLAVMASRKRLSVDQLKDIIRRSNGILQPKNSEIVPLEKRQTRGTSRQQAIDALRMSPEQCVTYKRIAELFDTVCGVCGECGMYDVEAICSECPLPEFVKRLA